MRIDQYVPAYLSVEIKSQQDKLISDMFVSGEITEKVAQHLLQGGCKLSKFYHLLKTHSMPVDETNIANWLQETGFPIRGIISGIGGPTERVAGFLDHFLQPGMKNLETFLQDTKHMLQLIEGVNDLIENGEVSLEGMGLVTLDLEKMYNNITDDLGMGAARKYFNSRITQGGQNYSTQDPEVSTESLMKGLSLCLKNNYFTFNNKVYKQKEGVGTGIKLAPPYACLAVGDYEKEIFKEDSPQIIETIKFWKRFIDDIFLLFKGSKELCDQLVEHLNNIMPGVIKLKCNYSQTSVDFLDLKIIIENGKLVTDLFVKPTNLQLYLDYRSNHPQPCKDAIVYCQALRVMERCSTIDLARPHLEQLRQRFLDRNYPEQVVTDQIKKAESKDRKSLIFKQRKQNSGGDKKVRLIFTNNQANPPIHQWIREGKKYLKSAKARVLADNMQVVYKQPKNLQQMAGGAKRGGNRAPRVADRGCHKCNHCRVACPVIKETKEFKSSNTGRRYFINEKVDCDSSYVVYLATCLRCQGQYVGKSVTKFKIRHSNHKQEIKHKKGGLGKHFGGSRACTYKDASFTIIEQVEIGNRALLAKREKHWQHQLRAFEDNGGNGMCIKKEDE